MKSVSNLSSLILKDRSGDEFQFFFCGNSIFSTSSGGYIRLLSEMISK